jgi:hypothetical protein
MENLGPNRRLREILVSLVISSLMPIFMVVEQNRSESLEQVSASAIKTTVCLCDIVSERYVDTFFIDAKAGLLWEVSFQPTDPQVESIIEVEGGYKIAISSSYKKAYELSLVSSTFETIILKGGNCGSKAPQINGPISLCLSTTGVYSLQSSDVYSFALSGGGVLNNLSQNRIEVIWGATAGTYQITAVNTTNPCMPDIIYEVTIGEAYVGSLACNNQINLSLDGSCTYKVELSNVFSGENTIGTALALVLKLKDGTTIPNNILTGEYVGKAITAHIIDGCGNNSCWGNVVFEDKTAPVMACTDTLTMECFKLQSDAVIVTANDCSPYEIRKVGVDQKTNLTCDPDFISRVMRKYQAIDIFGNVSDTCTVVLQVKRFPIDSVKFPADLTHENSLDCGVLVNRSYLPENTGFPTIHDVILDKKDYPECNIFVSYTDQIINLSNKTKIIRTWEILEWYCNTTNTIKHTQLIEISDNVAPNIATCVENLTVTTDGHQCLGSLKLPLLSSQNITDNCSKNFQHHIVINNQDSRKPGDVISLPLGIHQAVYKVTDEAGNSSSCNFTITVSDRTAPVATCKEFIVISLSQGGGYLTTNMIDNGSKDECSSVNLHIRRMDDPTERPYRDTINISCSDVEKPFRVMLRATDQAGNVNTCWTTVTVQDKSVPVLTVPADMTISCMEWMSKVDIKSFGEAQAYDQCVFTLQETLKENLNNCKVGTVVRTFTAKDATNTVTKTQTISVVNNTLSDLSTIIAPRDTVLSGMCNLQSLHPDSLAKLGVAYGRPVLPTGVCFNLGISYKDELFTVQAPVNTNCFKVIRTWRIINWCETPSSVLELKQTIGVENKIPPSITLLSSDSLFHSQTCESGEFTLRASGSDDCTPDNSLIWIWKILDNQKQVVLNGENSGKEVVVTRSIPIGNYTMLWSLRDGCGNIKEASQKFRIKYGKGASFFVVDTVAIALSAGDSTNSACITAGTLIMSASHACNVAVKYSFSPTNPNQDTICFQCKDLGYTPVTVYAHDAFGVVTSARSVIHVQDNNKINNCSQTTDCITWPADTTINACSPNISPVAINSIPLIDPNCDCNTFTLSHTDRIVPSGSAECLVIERIHFVTFRCRGIVTTFNNTQRINRRNAVNPIVACPLPRVTANSTANCAATLSIVGPEVLDAQCHTGLVFTHRINNGVVRTGQIANSSFEVGTSNVTFIVTDACGNSSSCNVEVVVSDGEAPICNVKDVTVFLDASGNGTISNPSIFDNGSTGACGPTVITFTTNRTQFTCEDLGGPVPVDITITASNGRTSNCQANVLVRDTIKPQLTLRNITREITSLDQVVTISSQELVVSATDNCFVQDTMIMNNTFTCQNVGQNTVSVTVRDVSGNTFTANAIVTILDRVPPSCNTRDVTIFVNDQGIATIGDASIFNAGSVNGCSGAPVTYTVNKTTFNCNEIGIPNPVIVTLTDALGNSMTCNANVFVQDTVKPQLITRNITREITSINQVISINEGDLVLSATDNCSTLADTIISINSFSCQNVGQNIVTVTVVDLYGNSTSETAVVTILDRVPPSCNTRDVTIFVNDQGIATIGDASIFNAGSVNGCSGATVTYTVNKTTFNCNEIGIPNPVIVTLTDALGNNMTCNANVFVQDTVKPQLITRNIIREITSVNQVISINEGDLVLSANDNCSTLADTIISINSFSCQNVGQNIVTVSIVDSYGNSTSGTAVVTILDRVPPTCNVRDLTVFVNSQGIATIEDASQFNAGSTSACTGADLNYSVSKNTFNCEDIGVANPVIVTVTDNLGNTMMCDAVVFVRDTLAPITTPKNVTIEITNENPSVTISKASVISSIVENCSLADTILSRSTFTCEDLGDNRVTIQVVDASGNRDTVEATVTVIDRQAPICIVRNISILLNTAGQALIGDASVFNAGSFDECNSIPLSFSVNKTMFTCENLGSNNPVIVTTTDIAGNSSTCSANVTVVDTIRPQLVVRNIQRTLTDVNTPIIVNAADLIVGASDNCSLADSANAPSVFTCANLGDNMVRVVVRDASGNVGNAEAIVTILDGITPECRLKTATIMVNGGTTTIDSSTVNDGSFDPCGEIVTFKVSPNTFTCDDIGEKIVTATITDGAGNVTTCQTTVTIIDGNQLICVPKDITVTLGDDNSVIISAADVDGGSGTGCGNPVQMSINRTRFTCEDVGSPQSVLLTVMRPGTSEMSVCTAMVTVVSPSNPRFICNVEEISVSCSEYNGVDIPNSVPRPTIAGSCGGNFKLDSTIIRLPRPCNLDTLTRTYLLFDLEDNLLGTCVQSIYIINDQPLSIASFDLPPQNVSLASCADKSIEQTGGAMTLKTTVDQGCADLAISFRDTFLTNTCNDTLRRIWTASDNCGSFSPIVYIQHIAINDTFAPIFSGVRDTIVFNQGDCGVQLNFDNIQVDDCDSRLTLSNDSPFARNSNNINPEGFYPVGVHTINLVASDVCGNSTNTSFTIEVRDTSTRNIVCRNVEKTIEPTGIVFVEARELVGFYGDNCNESFNPRVVMSQSGLDTVQNKTYSCDDLILVGQELIKIDTMTVQVYDGNNLIHSCTAVLVIRGGENCQNFFFITNYIKTTTNEVVSDFSVSLMNDGKEVQSSKTDRNGMAIISVPAGSEMMIVPSKNDDYLNGVNTLDLVQIQRHILGINKFRSPYHMLAADVNNDKKITVADIVEIRNMILGIKEKFDHHGSWIAIDANYEFPIGSNALDEDYPQYYELGKVSSGMELEFIGVKMGDVDVSYTANVLQNNLEQRNIPVEILVNDKQVEAGEMFTIELDVAGLGSLGADFTFTLNDAKLINVDGKDWIHSQNDNEVRTINYNGRTISNLLLTLKASKAGKISDYISLNNAEIYNSELITEHLSLKWQPQASNTIVESLKVYPNPMFAQTTIEFDSENNEEVTLFIADQFGKIKTSKSINVEKGLNKIVLDRNNFNSNGVYFLMIKTSRSQFASKIIVTE